MAEHFCGSDYSVHFSNGACEELFWAWVRLLERERLDREGTALLAFLRSRLGRADGGRGFGLDPPPPEIAASGRLPLLAGVIERFAAELCREKPDSTLTDVIDWDRELQINWLAKLIDLHELVCLAIENASDRPEKFVLDLPAEDRNECELARLLNRRSDRERRAKQSATPVTVDETIARLDELLDAASHCRLSRDIRITIAALFSDRASAKLQSGNADEAIADLRQSAGIDPVAKTRQMTLDTIEELAGESHN